VLSYRRKPMMLGLDLAAAPSRPSASQAVNAWSIAPDLGSVPAGVAPRAIAVSSRYGS
jgi:hypothetical protein